MLIIPDVMRNLEHTFAVTMVDPADTDLLSRIYKLRVTCREASGFVTFEKFPNGWYDSEDDAAKHFVVFDEDKLVASGRVNIYEALTDIPACPSFPVINIVPGRIGFLYRNGVLPAYRNMGISLLMNEARESYMKDNGCRYSMGYCRDFQVTNFLKHGYADHGVLDTGKVDWDLAPDNWHLMVKEL